MQLETTANNMQANERQKRRAATSIFSLDSRQIVLAR
jgi:hypothetical protein